MPSVKKTRSFSFNHKEFDVILVIEHMLLDCTRSLDFGKWVDDRQITSHQLLLISHEILVSP